MITAAGLPLVGHDGLVLFRVLRARTMSMIDDLRCLWMVHWRGHESTDLVRELGHARSAEQYGEILWRAGGLSGVGCLLAYDLQDSGRAEVELIKQEVVRMKGLQSESAEGRRWEVADIGGHDGLSAGPDCCSDDVTVIDVRQGYPCFKILPSGDQGIVECLAHVSETLLDIDAGVDLLNGCLSLCEDPV
ncbi:MAG: hypothetical protein ACRDRJ_26735 [Streptosporangiaceae bacterium]